MLVLMEIYNKQVWDCSQDTQTQRCTILEIEPRTLPSAGLYAGPRPMNLGLGLRY